MTLIILDVSCSCSKKVLKHSKRDIWLTIKNIRKPVLEFLYRLVINKCQREKAVLLIRFIAMYSGMYDYHELRLKIPK